MVSGHTITDAEVGSALSSHTSVAGTAVIGNPDAVKGNIIRAFVIPHVGHSADSRLKNDHHYYVKITPWLITMPSEIKFVLSPQDPQRQDHATDTQDKREGV